MSNTDPIVKSAVITGAGSGVGRSTAIKLATLGWQVALIGRRQDSLEETAAKIAAPERTMVCPCDASDPVAVEAVGAEITARFGDIDALVNSAGANVPKRSFAELSVEDYQRIINTNLNATYYFTQAFLDAMRKRGSGTIVNVVSDAGIFPHLKAGPSYVASKFGARGLTQALNAEERGNGIRACCLLPGDINTEFLKHRPNVPDESARSKMLSADDVAECAVFAILQPEHVLVEEILVRPR